MNLARAKRRWKAWDRYTDRIITGLERHLMTGLAVVVWFCWIAAWLSMWAGNPTAINGVVGAGICVPIVTAAAILVRPRGRDRRRR